MFKLVVLACAMVGAAVGSVVAPLSYGGVVSPYSYGAYPYSAVYSPYAAALSQAPHSPAVVLDAVRGVPLDTPEVVAARAAHYQAKLLSPLHHLKKRSVAPVAYSSVLTPFAYSSPAVSAYASPVVTSYSAYATPAVSAYSAPVLGSTLSYHGVTPSAYSVLLKK